jgi:formate hydrogenlyase subunit 4
LLQPYRDLIKLTHKQPVVSKDASWLFIIVPYIIFSTTALAVSVVPLLAVDLPTASSAGYSFGQLWSLTCNS